MMRKHYKKNFMTNVLNFNEIENKFKNIVFMQKKRKFIFKNIVLMRKQSDHTPKTRNNKSDLQNCN